MKQRDEGYIRPLPSNKFDAYTTHAEDMHILNRWKSVNPKEIRCVCGNDKFNDIRVSMILKIKSENDMNIKSIIISERIDRNGESENKLNKNVV